MKTQKIYSKSDVYQKFEVLKTNRNKRYKYNQFFVEGVRNINEAIKNGWHICSFIYDGKAKLSNWANDILASVNTDLNYELTVDLMKELSGKEDTSELLAVMEMRADDFSQLKLNEKPLLALFDRPSNRGNLGTIIRSCDSLGVNGLIITGHAVDLYDPEVIGSSMGSFFNVPVVRATDNEMVMEYINKLKETYPGFKTIGTTAHKQKNIFEIDLSEPLLFMIGNETEGLCRFFKETCDILATIPMAGSSSASSFNVGCAATVMFYEAVRQRMNH